MKWTGDGLEKFEKAVKALGSKQARAVYRSAVNAQGALLRKDAVRILPEQSGLEKKTIQTALGKPMKAGLQRLSYKISARGGFIRMKYFKAGETKEGVIAFPRNKQVFQPNHFMMAGRFPNRKALPAKFNGQVFQPKNWGATGKSTWGRTIASGKRSDVRIPDELTSPAMVKLADKHRDGIDAKILAGIKKLSGGIID